MMTDPLTATALLGTARMSAMPPPPDPSLEPAWSSIPIENPASAVLQGLALTRALHRAGMKTREVVEEITVCPPESRPPLASAAVDLAMRLLSGEYPEVLPEWLRFVEASGRVLPARVVPDLLAAATHHEALRRIAPALTGERGRWMARRHERFSWLLETTAVEESAWETGQPSERLAWLRQTRAQDPARAASVIAAHWAGEDATMREAIVRMVAAKPWPCDEAWLENLALKDRRQEIRELAAVSLSEIPESGFRARAIARVHGRVKVERRLLKRVITAEPPASFDPAWAADGIKEKPPQGVGEKAWWLRQIAALVPLDEWPGLLGIGADELFALARDQDWQEALVAGWIDSARRMPGRALAAWFVPFIATFEPWPPQAAAKHQVLQLLLDAQPPDQRFGLLDRLSGSLPLHLAIDLIARCGQPPPDGKGKAVLALIAQAIRTLPSPLTRPQARALALCVPPAEIQGRLEILSQLPELSAPAEEFANTLEFRRSMISHFSTP